MTVVTTQLEPIGDRVVIRVLPNEETTQGGIVLPDAAQEKPQRGEVLAVGPGRRLDNGQLYPLDVAVGDRVLFAKFAGTEVKDGGQPLLILLERELLAIIR